MCFYFFVCSTSAQTEERVELSIFYVTWDFTGSSAVKLLTKLFKPTNCVGGVDAHALTSRRKRGRMDTEEPIQKTIKSALLFHRLLHPESCLICLIFVLF
ncbi:hypothetical protein FQA47_010069 [Oryzias melastigma]|uniref:Uncharacterized protein n=1 Tax=Oryzias melastigma TaxID=30732 RepID=A0A834FHQ8_ORYME|nr:hypothetical protein FQA47_010069 [Oryzias melastigma]